MKQIQIKLGIFTQSCMSMICEPTNATFDENFVCFAAENFQIHSEFEECVNDEQNFDFDADVNI